MAIRELYRAKQLPIFQNRMFRTATEARACTKGEMILVRDLETGLIFNQAFRPELMQYDADYQNEQAVSSVFRSHISDVTELIHKHFSGQTLIEVGCGKGFFLEHLYAQGFRITGLDPSYDGDSPHVIKEYFTPEIGLSVDGIILRHVLEHVTHPIEFLQHIRDANGSVGKIYIEVPCFDWICNHRAWFDVFYEHVNYFRSDDFQRIFDTVYEAGHIFNGQYLYVVADLAKVHAPRLSEADKFSFPADFVASVTSYAEMIKASSASIRHHTIIWGGASKGVIFALFMQRNGVKIDFIIDINQAKQGKYLAATGIKVSSPEEALAQIEPGSTIFVMNSNYLSEIRQITLNQFNYLTVDHENL
ncbi:MAG: methyltransferase domain-containing protein [Desulfobulbaceae bacterium]|nr:methyltransferase domain-containing protein [Desulfobulbaceae bacterium]